MKLNPSSGLGDITYLFFFVVVVSGNALSKFTGEIFEKVMSENNLYI